jgi:predicted amidophosphoribosyltransferase
LTLSFDGQVLSRKPRRKSIFSRKKTARCDLVYRQEKHKKGDFYYISFWKRSVEGYLLRDIKKNDENIQLFADKIVEYITGVYGDIQGNDYCIITTPKRRHKTSNFSDKVCKLAGARLHISYYENAVISIGKRRIRPLFRLTKDIKEVKIILFDDIITTGSTMTATYKLLTGKNVIVIAGINNNK